MTNTSSAGLSAICLALTLYGCSEGPTPVNSAPNPEPTLVGSDRDAHGCIPSAGYQWCEALAECQRPWELAHREGLENTAEAFQQFCAN